MRSISVRIEAALATRNEDRRWQLISSLVRECPDDVLDACSGLLASEQERRRTLGADVLGRLVQDEPDTRPGALTLLLAALETESRPAALASLVAALGHLGDRSALGPIVRLAAHADPAIRLAVAFAIASIGSTPPSGEALAALIRLSRDSDVEVRDWATFGLGTLSNADGPDVRAALLARAEDSYSEARAEALFGLAIRRDPRAVPPLIRALESAAAGKLEVEAAAEAADPRLVPALEAMDRAGRGDRHQVRRAIDRCRGREERPRLLS